MKNMMDKIPNRADWLFESDMCDILKDKNALARSYFKYMLSQTLEMFEYDGLPETIPQKEVEILHQVNGSCIWKEVNGQKYVFFGGLGGVLDEYYHPTLAVVSNPYLKYSADLEIGKDCVVTFNTKIRESLTPMFNKYAMMLAECDISMRFAVINARLPAILSADDDNTKDSAEKVIADIWKGEKFGIVATKKIAELNKDGLMSSEFASRSQSNIKDLIELRQYIKSSWYMELGIQSNYNMKRESLNSSETTMDESVLLPLIDDMLKSRQDGLKQVNEMWGTNITVKLSSSWEKIREEIKNELAKQETEIEENANGDVENVVPPEETESGDVE